MQASEPKQDYPTIETPNGRFFGRPVEPDEDYEFLWVVIDGDTGEHIANATEETTKVLVEALNA